MGTNQLKKIMLHTIAGLRQGLLDKSTHLKISEGLTQFPIEILELADTLEVLDLAGNQLSQLPDDFSCLKHLKILFLSDNKFEQFPSVLAACPELSMIGFRGNRMKSVAENSIPVTTRWLILTDNLISKLPQSIGQLPKLQKLMLAGNQLTQIPESIQNCRNLQLLRISANQLTQLPDAIFALPELSWLAFSGNPFCQSQATSTMDLPGISWSDIDQGDTLGQGASGVISKATWRDDAHTLANATQPVVVKQYKGSLTSDGYSADELAAVVLAGQHENLIPLVAKIEDNNHTGLLMRQISADFKNLGQPPSMQSCTRDQFDEGLQLSGTDILKIAVQVISVMQHLLEKCICHGDLYAHNILVNPEADILLSDFGAASSYRALTDKQAHAMQKIEVRAFGCLLDDLLTTCDSRKSKLPVLLEDLKDRCMQATISNRPTFDVIVAELKNMQKVHF